jgi:hypothetical protein
MTGGQVFSHSRLVVQALMHIISPPLELLLVVPELLPLDPPLLDPLLDPLPEELPLLELLPDEPPLLELLTPELLPLLLPELLPVTPLLLPLPELLPLMPELLPVTTPELLPLGPDSWPASSPPASASSSGMSVRAPQPAKRAPTKAKARRWDRMVAGPRWAERYVPAGALPRLIRVTGSDGVCADV